MKRTVIILTLSEKWGGKCVAAYDNDSQKIVRLVSSKDGDGIPNCYVSNVSLLDVVKVNIIQNCPLEHQTENVLIDLSQNFETIGHVDNFEQLAFLANKHPPVFGNSNYKILSANGLNHSLEVVRFNSMSFSRSDNQKIKVNFWTNGQYHCNYSVTDRHYFEDPHQIQSGYAVISLPPSDDFTDNGGGYFKYVSAIY